MELDWRILRVEGSAEELHAFRPADISVRSMVFMHPERPTIVLGSAQRLMFDAVSERVGGTAVAVRDSGGGAVMVAPGAQVWVTLFLPADDPLAVDDLSQSFLWLGDLTTQTLEQLGVEGCEICTVPSPRSDVSRAICFGGYSYGELLVGGRKLTGISQRRTRTLRIFHLMILLEDRQSELVALLNPLYGGTFVPGEAPLVTTLPEQLDGEVSVTTTEEEFGAMWARL